MSLYTSNAPESQNLTMKKITTVFLVYIRKNKLLVLLHCWELSCHDAQLVRDLALSCLLQSAAVILGHRKPQNPLITVKKKNSIKPQQFSCAEHTLRGLKNIQGAVWNRLHTQEDSVCTQGTKADTNFNTPYSLMEKFRKGMTQTIPVSCIKALGSGCGYIIQMCKIIQICKYWTGKLTTEWL